MQRQGDVLDPLKLEFQVVVSHNIWVLGTELQSLAWSACLNSESSLWAWRVFSDQEKAGEVEAHAVVFGEWESENSMAGVVLWTSDVGKVTTGGGKAQILELKADIVQTKMKISQSFSRRARYL